MTDEQIIEYCRKLIINNLSNQDQNFTNEIACVLGNDKALLSHCFGIKELMTACIEILENKGVSLDD